eukprot:3629474-Rhodomonas_salina.1
MRCAVLRSGMGLPGQRSATVGDGDPAKVPSYAHATCCRVLTRLPSYAHATRCPVLTRLPPHAHATHCPVLTKPVPLYCACGVVLRTRSTHATHTLRTRCARRGSDGGVRCAGAAAVAAERRRGQPSSYYRHRP